MGTTVEKLNKVLETKEAIRTSINNKGGTLTENDTFSSYSTAIDNIKTGSEENFNALVDRTITIAEGEATEIGDYAFQSCVNLTTAKFKNATKIGNSAFNDCSSLKDVDFSSVSFIDSRGVRNCTSLEKLDLPSLTYEGINQEIVNQFSGDTALKEVNMPIFNASYSKVANGMFTNCNSLITVNAPKMTYVPEGMFYLCSSLTNVNAPITEVSALSFRGCSSLKVFDFSRLVKINGNSAFNDCSSLEEAVFTNTYTYDRLIYNTFYGCSSLKKVDLCENIKTMIGSSCFYNCSSLQSLIVRYANGVVPLENSNAFTNSLIASSETEGYIYVPDNLAENYETATNWSVYSNKIKPISLIGKNIGDLDNVYIENNNTISKTIYLFGFTNTPEVEIISNDESVGTINNIVVSKDKITFDINALSIGSTTIDINVSGDFNKAQSIELNVTTTINSYSVEEIEGSTYGFTLNGSGYYENTNKGHQGTFAVCKLKFNATKINRKLKLECINYGGGYSASCFGMISKVDKTLELSTNNDTNNAYKSYFYVSGTTHETLSFIIDTIGEHFIYLKFVLGMPINNATLQFKVIEE
ncbi:MAG: leucine-rich repeat domain-containing protein [Lactobacillus amylovorus]|nr:leucine-rich repeat domain-containing protein [Lactobacillus amylovorus]